MREVSRKKAEESIRYWEGAIRRSKRLKWLKLFLNPERKNILRFKLIIKTSLLRKPIAHCSVFLKIVLVNFRSFVTFGKTILLCFSSIEQLSVCFETWLRSKLPFLEYITKRLLRFTCSENAFECSIWTRTCTRTNKTSFQWLFWRGMGRNCFEHQTLDYRYWCWDLRCCSLNSWVKQFSWWERFMVSALSRINNFQLT